MTIQAPFDRYEGEVLPEWIDLNGHMNLAYYVVLFDYATDMLFEAIGIGREYKDATSHGTFVAETHNLYEPSCWSASASGSPPRSSVLTTSACIWRMRCSASPTAQRAATQELMYLHIDLVGPSRRPLARRSVRTHRRSCRSPFAPPYTRLDRAPDHNDRLS